MQILPGLFAWKEPLPAKQTFRVERNSVNLEFEVISDFWGVRRRAHTPKIGSFITIL